MRLTFGSVPTRLAKLARRTIVMAVVVGVAVVSVSSGGSTVPPDRPIEAIPSDGIGAVAGAQYHGDGLSLSATESGARLRCVFQKIEGEVLPSGLWLVSTEEGRSGDRFQVIARAAGRAARKALASTGTVEVTSQQARFIRPNLIEEYTVSVDGLRQDFVILERPAGRGKLRVDLQVTGARAESAADGVRLVLAGSGREIAYNRLHAADARGRELDARIDVATASRLVLVVNDADAVYPIRIDPTFSDADWSALGDGMSQTVRAVVVSGTEIYVGGDFEHAGVVRVNHVAKWNGCAWSPLAQGMSNFVRSLAVSGNYVYAGCGAFDPGTAGSQGFGSNYIAKYDLSTRVWSALGSGLNSHVHVLVVHDPFLYVGGTFNTAGGSPAGRVARWTLGGTTDKDWSAVGTGIPGSLSAGRVVFDLEWSGDILYAGGSFSGGNGNPGAAFAGQIAKWDSVTDVWSAVGTGVGAFTEVRALALYGTDLYAGGDFTTAGGNSANHIAKWNGSAWSTLGTAPIDGANSIVYALAVYGSDLYVGGAFTTAGGVSANRIAKWDLNGNGWSAVGSGLDGTVNVLVVHDDFFYAGGTFTEAGGTPANRIVRGNLAGGTLPDCNDGIACTADSCSPQTASCVHAPSDAACDDGLYCNGVETCNAASGCLPGAPPGCSDSIACTDDSCNEQSDSCDHAPNDALCDDGLSCNGVETCDVMTGCVPGTQTASCETPSFAPAQNYSSGGSVPFSVVVGDFDGDGHLDVVVTNTNANSKLLKGNGDGTFQSAITVYAGTMSFMAAGKIDGDTALDLAAGTGAAAVNVLLNDGTGVFTPFGPFFAGPAAAVYSVVVADVDGDGDSDLVTANQGSPGTISVLLGDGTGMTFSSPIDFTVGAGPLHVTVARLNTSDDYADLAVANADSSNVSILLGNGTAGLFDLAVNYGVGLDPRATAVGDFDCDGDLDLVVANGRANNAQVLLGNGNGTFQPPVIYPTGLSPVSVAVDDFNGDGMLDFVTADPDSHRVSVLLGNGNGTFRPAVGFGTGAIPFDVAVGDFNGCGPDLVTANRGTNDVSVLLDTCRVCDDGLYCNGVETCLPGGGCAPGTPPNCDDGVACTIDSCNEGTDACDHTPDHAVCNDPNPCTDDACVVGAGCQHTNNTIDCNDGDLCTTDDRCAGGTCGGTPVVCTPADSCRAAGSCDPATGACSNPVAQNGANCDDGDACTTNDVCLNGVCTNISSSYAVYGGAGFTCAIRSSGRLKCWGVDTYSQVSGPNASLDSFVAVSTTWWHTCAIRVDGRVRCWGRDISNDVSHPNQDTGTYTAVATGQTNTCALGTDGRLKCWGGDQFGEKSGPNGSTDTFIAVGAGLQNSCGVRTDGKLRCWGDDAYGRVSGPSASAFTFTSVSLGGRHTCGLRSDGRVVCWGEDVAGCVSGPNNDTGSYTFVSLGAQTCALRPDRRLMCWGYNGQGQITAANASTKSYASVSSGGGHLCALDDGGRLSCWGSDVSGSVAGPNASTDVYGSTATDCNDFDACTNDSCISPTGCHYEPTNCRDTDACTIDTCDSVSGCHHTATNGGEHLSTPIGAGGTLTTDTEGDGATPADPIETTVTTPNAGTVTIDESCTSTLPLPGLTFLNLLVHVTAPGATASNPLILSFRIDASALPPSFNIATLQVRKNGTVVQNCSAPSGTATPNPCVSNRSLAPDGDALVTVLTSTLSTFDFAMPSCEDADACTVDLGEPGSCSNTPVVCMPSDQCHSAGTCSPETGLCSNPNASNGTSCEDGDACTTDDVCAEGACAGAAIPPPVEVNDTLAVAKSGGDAVVTWTDQPGSFNVYRGSRPAGGAWSYNQSCLDHATALETATDSLPVPPGTLAFYLVSRIEDCGESNLGRQSSGAPIPNPNPCTGSGRSPGQD